MVKLIRKQETCSYSVKTSGIRQISTCIYPEDPGNLLESWDGLSRPASLWLRCAAIAHEDRDLGRGF
jgi:hypothetical protein